MAESNGVAIRTGRVLVKDGLVNVAPDTAGCNKCCPCTCLLESNTGSVPSSYDINLHPAYRVVCVAGVDLSGCSLADATNEVQYPGYVFRTTDENIWHINDNFEFEGKVITRVELKVEAGKWVLRYFGGGTILFEFFKIIGSTPDGDYTYNPGVGCGKAVNACVLFSVPSDTRVKLQVTVVGIEPEFPLNECLFGATAPATNYSPETNIYWKWLEFVINGTWLLTFGDVNPPLPSNQRYARYALGSFGNQPNGWYRKTEGDWLDSACTEVQGTQINPNWMAVPAFAHVWFSHLTATKLGTIRQLGGDSGTWVFTQDVRFRVPGSIVADYYVWDP